MILIALRWRHNGCDSVSNHQPHHCWLNHLFRRRSKKTSKLRVTGLCVGNSSGTGEFPAQMASNAENVSIWWRHHMDFISTLFTDEMTSSHSTNVAHLQRTNRRQHHFLACLWSQDTWPLGRELGSNNRARELSICHSKFKFDRKCVLF